MAQSKAPKRRRYPTVEPLSDETILQAMYRQKRLIDHWRRVDEAKPSVDDGPPRTCVDLRHKLKHIVVKGECLAKLEQDNVRMLRAIISVMKGPGSVDHYHKRKLGNGQASHGFEERERFYERVNRENKAMLRRLVSTRTVYNHIKMEMDYQRAIRGKKKLSDVYKWWKNNEEWRERWLKTGKQSGLTGESFHIDMDALRQEMIERHRNCFPSEPEKFQPQDVPYLCSSPSGTSPVDHERCFTPLQGLPPVVPPRRAFRAVKPQQVSSGEFPVRTTRAQELRAQATQRRQQTLFPLTSPRGDGGQHRGKNNNSAINMNQSASTTYPRSHTVFNKRSPYHTELTLDKLGTVTLPPIAECTTHDPKGKDAVLKDGNNHGTVLQLPKLPLSQLSRDTWGFRECALGPSDTSISTFPRPQRPGKEDPKKRGQEQTAASFTTPLERRIRQVQARYFQGTAVTSHAGRAAMTKLPAKSAGNASASHRSVKFCTVAKPSEQFGATTENAHEVAENLSKPAVCQSRLEKPSSTKTILEKPPTAKTSQPGAMGPWSVKKPGCASETEHGAEHLEFGESVNRKTALVTLHSRPKPATRGCPDTHSSARDTALGSEESPKSLDLQRSLSKRSPRICNPRTLKRGDQKSSFSAVSSACPVSVSGHSSHCCVPTSLDSGAPFSYKPVIKRDTSEWSSRHPHGPHLKTSTVNDTAEDPELTSQPVSSASKTGDTWSQYDLSEDQEPKDPTASLSELSSDQWPEQDALPDDLSECSLDLDDSLSYADREEWSRNEDTSPEPASKDTPESDQLDVSISRPFPGGEDSLVLEWKSRSAADSPTVRSQGHSLDRIVFLGEGSLLHADDADDTAASSDED